VYLSLSKIEPTIDDAIGKLFNEVGSRKSEAASKKNLVYEWGLSPHINKRGKG
jgi:hypothetical protein